MKFTDWQENGKVHYLELSRRNLETLLQKLDDPDSKRMLVAPGGRIYVHAVENEEHYADREPGPVELNGVVV